jgi:hypothetical protein
MADEHTPKGSGIDTKELDDWLDGALAELEQRVDGLRLESAERADSLRRRLLGLPARLLGRKPKAPESPSWYDDQTWTVGSIDKSLVEKPERRPLLRRLLSEGTLWFLSSAALYLIVGAFLVYRHDVIQGDSLSRLANGYYVITSRFPHAGAIGFVWNPLPSLLTLPFIPLKHVAPSLFTHGYLMNIESALFMAGTVVLVARFLRQHGVPDVWRVLITVTFAVSPMIVLYGANGMSEAMMLFFIVAACLSSSRWLETGSTRALVTAGLCLALAYLTRDEGLVAAVGIMVVVGILGFDRAAGAWRARLRRASVDVSIVGLPFVLTFGVLAGIAYELVHQPFPAFTSQYGNTTQVHDKFGGIAAVLQGGTGAAARIRYSLTQGVLLEPLLVLIVLFAFYKLLRRDGRMMIPVAGLGSVLVFHWVEFARGQTFGWLRFSITEIPLAVMLGGLLLADRSRAPLTSRSLLPVPRETNRWLAELISAAVVIALIAGSPTQLAAMQSPRIGREEAGQVAAFSARLGRPGAYDQVGVFKTQRTMAAWLDAQHLKEGAVLTDDAYTFGMILASSKPKQFIVDSDYDYDAALADPVTFHVRYVVVPDPAVFPHDRVNQAHPNLFVSGDQDMKLAQTFTDRTVTFKVYAVNPA